MTKYSSDQNQDSAVDASIEPGQSWVSAQYKESKVEQPSQAIDAAILAMAKQHSAEPSHSQNSKKPGAWLFPTSMVASVMMIAVFYWSSPQQLSDNAIQGELLVSPSAPVQFEPTNQSERMASTDATDAGINRYAARAQDQHSMAHQDTAIQERNEQSVSPNIARLKLLPPGEQAAESYEAPPESMGQIIVTMELIRKTFGMSHEQMMQTPEQDVAHASNVERYQSLQQQLFERVLQQKQQTTDWSIDPAVRSLLTEQQLTELLPPEPTRN